MASAIHKSEPKRFNEAREVADRFKEGTAVIMNLQSTDDTIARRLVDFASGLVYGLDGKIELVANRVYLLTPADVEVSAEERERIAGGCSTTSSERRAAGLPQKMGSRLRLLASAPHDLGGQSIHQSYQCRPDALLVDTSHQGRAQLARAGRVRPPVTGPFRSGYELLLDVTEPVLRPLRRIIPPVGMFDVSIVVAFVIILVLQQAIR